MSGEDTPSEAPSARERQLAGLKPPWKPGQSGNPAGRPKGARSKLSENFFQVLHDDFEKHGIKVIEAMRADKPVDYAKMIASLQSKEVTGEDGQPLFPDSIDWNVRDT